MAMISQPGSPVVAGNRHADEHSAGHRVYSLAEIACWRRWHLTLYRSNTRTAGHDMDPIFERDRFTWPDVPLT